MISICTVLFYEEAIFIYMFLGFYMTVMTLTLAEQHAMGFKDGRRPKFKAAPRKRALDDGENWETSPNET